MNGPTIRSAAGSCGGLPETVRPKTTSSPPPERERSTAHAAWMRAPRVIRRSCAIAASCRDVPVARRRAHAAWRLGARTGARRLPGSGVGAAKPSRYRVQKSSAWARSQRLNQSTKSLYGGTADAGGGTPRVRASYRANRSVKSGCKLHSSRIEWSKVSTNLVSREESRSSEPRSKGPDRGSKAWRRSWSRNAATAGARAGAGSARRSQTGKEM